MTGNERVMADLHDRRDGEWLPRGLPTLAVKLPSGARAFLIDAGGFLYCSSSDATPLEVAAALGIDRSIIQSNAGEQHLFLSMRRMQLADPSDPIVREWLHLRGLTPAQLARWTLTDCGAPPAEWGWIAGHISIDSERVAA